MTRTIKTLMLTGVCALVLAGPVAAETQDSVRDERGNVVTDSRGNCVRTKWSADSDACGKPAPVAPKAEAPKPAPAPAPAPKLSREDLSIYFAFDKADLQAEGRSKLDTLVAKIKGMKEVKSIGVVGYADEIGKSGYNQKLSEERARAVAEDVISQGYRNTSVMDVRALGASSSKSECEGVKKRQEKIECLWRDRRVEIELEYYK